MSAAKSERDKAIPPAQVEAVAKWFKAQDQMRGRALCEELAVQVLTAIAQVPNQQASAVRINEGDVVFIAARLRHFGVQVENGVVQSALLDWERTSSPLVQRSYSGGGEAATAKELYSRYREAVGAEDRKNYYPHYWAGLPEHYKRLLTFMVEGRTPATGQENEGGAATLLRELLNYWDHGLMPTDLHDWRNRVLDWLRASTRAPPPQRNSERAERCG